MSDKTRTTKREWWETHDGLTRLADYLAENGSTGKEVAYAIEKPWKFNEEYEEATRALMEEA